METLNGVSGGRQEPTEQWIDKHALNALIKSFTNLETSEQTQRWVRPWQGSRKIQADSSGRWESLRWNFSNTVQKMPKSFTPNLQDCKLLPSCGSARGDGYRGGWEHGSYLLACKTALVQSALLHRLRFFLNDSRVCLYVRDH